jgi:hypothetical protein
MSRANKSTARARGLSGTAESPFSTVDITPAEIELLSGLVGRQKRFRHIDSVLTSGDTVKDFYRACDDTTGTLCLLSSGDAKFGFYIEGAWKIALNAWTSSIPADFAFILNPVLKLAAVGQVKNELHSLQ